jgi:hypothetical protein
MTMSHAPFIVIETDHPGDERFLVARLAMPAAPLVSKVAIYTLVHTQPISFGRAESAVIDLNRGGDGRGPHRLP